MTADYEINRKLDVLIATHGDDGLRHVDNMILPVVSGVTYIVIWQTSSPTEIPAGLLRPDVEIHAVSGTGLSNNRNAGLKLARAPYCLIADNDLLYQPQGLQAVIDSLDAHPEVDVATFRHDGEPVYYPEEEADLTERMPRGYNVSSIDISFRRKSIGNIHFDTNFGICAPLASNEDSIFLLDCRRAGLKCRFFPITIVEHNGLSTGNLSITDHTVAMAEGAYIRLAYGLAGYPRIPLFAWRAKRKGRMPFLWGLWHLTRGFFSHYVSEHNSLTRNHRKSSLTRD